MSRMCTMSRLNRSAKYIAITCIFYVFLPITHINAIEQRTKCKVSTNAENDARLNDVNYEFDASTVTTRNCDDITDTDYELKAATTIRPQLETSYDESFEAFSSSHRQPRSMTHMDGAVAMSTTTSTPSSNHRGSVNLAVSEERGQNPNADIQDIITGIVKLLNGNVIVQNSVPLPTRRYATRINNRGPPRISDLPPIVPNIEEKFPIHMTTPYPTLVRKPAVPYPFDLPDNMHTQLLPPAVPVNDYAIKAHGQGVNKPNHTTVPPNRPPWHGNRTRQPIVGNPNRMHVPTRQPIQHPTPQTTQDYRPLLNTQNAMTPFYGKASEKYATTTTATADDYVDEKDESDDGQSDAAEMPVQLSSAESIPSTEHIIKLDTMPAQNDELFTTSKIDLNVSTENYPNLNLPQPTVTRDNLLQTTSSSTKIPSFNAFGLFNEQMTTIQSYPKVSATPELPAQVPSIQISAVRNSSIRHTINSTNSLIEKPTQIAPSKVVSTTHKIESTDFKSYYARPGIVLDDTIDFSRKDLQNGPPQTPPLLATNYHHGHGHGQDANIQSTASLSNIYAEIFDVTLSAIQGPGGGSGAHKVVDLFEIENTGGLEVRPTRVHPNDIIVTASDDNSFVSIDGKRTYINLFGETAENDHLRKSNLATKSYSDHPQTKSAIETTGDKSNSIAVSAAKPTSFTKPPPATNHTTHYQPPTSMRYNNRMKNQQNQVRIDTCIVGDDSTCDVAQNEICKTDVGVSSCHCRPGYSRRKYRDPCRKVVSLLLSMRIDKYYDKLIVWDKVFADPDSAQYEHLSFEAIRAIDSVMSMTPFSDDFIAARVNSIYEDKANPASTGVFVNFTIQMEGNANNVRGYIQSELQKQLIAVVYRRNNNIGNSALYVEDLTGSISALQDLDECLSPDLNDCHANANCTNVWGTFECRCAVGLRDPWSDQYQRAGRECISCSNSHCNNRGICLYDDMGTQLMCKCMNNYYGSQCEIDGDILTVAIGASVTAILIITLTLVCLVIWGRRWNQEQKQMIGSPIFDYINRSNVDNQMKTMPPKTYQAALEDRMRWAQIADVMSQSNHYAIEPVHPQRPPSAPLYVYQNMHTIGNTPNLTSLSLAGTMQHRGMSELKVPMPSLSRMGFEQKRMRRHETTSSSEEDDSVDLLGSNYQTQTGIYYDLDGESSDQPPTIPSNRDERRNGSTYSGMPTVQRVPMTTYTPKSRVYS